MSSEEIKQTLDILIREIQELKTQNSVPLAALSTKQAAEAMGGISEKSVKRLEIRGKIKRVSGIGRVLYSTKSIKEFCND